MFSPNLSTKTDEQLRRVLLEAYRLNARSLIYVIENEMRVRGHDAAIANLRAIYKKELKS